MIEPMIAYLGRPVSDLLKLAPFQGWLFKRSVEDDLDEREVSYVFKQRGLGVLCDYRIYQERIKTIFLSDGFDEALMGFPFSARRDEVLAAWGRPSRSGEPHTDPILGKYGAWDRFDDHFHAVHFEYHPDGDRLKRVTLMCADIAP